MNKIDWGVVSSACVALVAVICVALLFNRSCSVVAYKACLDKATETTQCKELEP